MAGAERKEVIAVSLEDFYKSVTDYAAYPQFVSGVKNAKLVSESGGTKRVEFEIDMMKRFKYALDIREVVDAGAGTASVDWTLASSDMLKANTGGWKLKRLGPASTEVVYKLDLEFGISVPGFVLKGLISKALPQAIQEFADHAKKVGGGK